MPYINSVNRTAREKLCDKFYCDTSYTVQKSRQAESDLVIKDMNKNKTVSTDLTVHYDIQNK